ncbi:HlyD family secretion protein [Paracoccus aminovorans]|uniref:HlyD family secretion protein n=1 Tax=Paracoccus aminovorans TaxID=34004 RepID=A0A1I3DGE4_9RHOB|nr:hypothetical protein [Paracoccus aminovorans]CQR84075.1 truncated multidrug transporter [Paracoccus aminovorans]SFH85852.1 HlyD family secretion protein [Paracoccus aminovorans]
MSDDGARDDDPLRLESAVAIRAGGFPCSGPASRRPGGGAAEAGAPVSVTVSTLVPERVVLRDEVPGRVAAFRRVEIRPQVGGLILERPVDEGARVAAGDVLFPRFARRS